jgi:hypothetical protein
MISTHTKKNFGEKKTLISGIKKKIIRFLQQILVGSQNIQCFLLSYLVYSQIWLIPIVVEVIDHIYIYIYIYIYMSLCHKSNPYEKILIRRGI